jgi:hypothetical protein
VRIQRLVLEKRKCCVMCSIDRALFSRQFGEQQTELYRIELTDRINASAKDFCIRQVDPIIFRFSGGVKRRVDVAAKPQP